LTVAQTGRDKEIVMNTKIKIVAGVIVGLIAGVMLVGTAVAAPRMMATPAFNGYRMMNTASTSGTFDRPTIAEMNAFMDRYRTSNGSIDVNRMRADVISGRVTPPCLDGAQSTKQSTKRQGEQTSLRRGPVMMRTLSSNSGSTGYGMMGSTY
jgi:hypothetical protein